MGRAGSRPMQAPGVARTRFPARSVGRIAVPGPRAECRTYGGVGSGPDAADRPAAGSGPALVAPDGAFRSAGPLVSAGLILAAAT